MIKKCFYKFNQKQGQSLTEYALILGLVVVVGIAALSQWGGHINKTVEILNGALDTVNDDITTTGH